MCSYNSQGAHNPHFDIVYLTYTTFSMCIKVWFRSEKSGIFASVGVLLVKNVYLQSERNIMGFKVINVIKASPCSFSSIP